MPRLIRAPSRHVRSRIFDSARWEGYRPREDDIIIATYSKCGTTWMQRIVSMLLFQSAAPLSDLGPVAVARHASVRTDRSRTRESRGADASPLLQNASAARRDTDLRRREDRSRRARRPRCRNVAAQSSRQLQTRARRRRQRDQPGGSEIRQRLRYPAGPGAVLLGMDRRRWRPGRRRRRVLLCREFVLERALERKRSARALQRSEGGPRRGNAPHCGLPRNRNARTAVAGNGRRSRFRRHEGARRRADSGGRCVVGGRRVAIHEQRHQRPLAIGSFCG